jgi:hypothetical protein
MSNDNLEEQLEIQMKAFESSVNTRFLTPRGFAKYFNVYLLSQQPKEQGVSQELIEAAQAVVDVPKHNNGMWMPMEDPLAALSKALARAKALPNSTGTMPEGMVEKIMEVVNRTRPDVDECPKCDGMGCSGPCPPRHWEEPMRKVLSSLPWPEQGQKYPTDEWIAAMTDLIARHRGEWTDAEWYARKIGIEMGITYMRDHGYLSPKEQVKEP